ncbi:MAG: IS4 family transposase [Candidatus Methanoperedens sp.]|nr:IS4 family transposase [Candidatus Methanoperedens sp.]
MTKEYLSYDPQVIEKDLCNVFSPEWLEYAARETGLIKRERKIKPFIMFWVLVMSFGVRLERNLANIKRSYEKASYKKLSDSSWYERFTPELVIFLKLCVTHAIEHLAHEQNRVLGEKIARFRDVLIQDSTIVRLHKALAKKWPAARSRTVAAGVKVSALVSAVADGPKRIGIYAESTNDLKTLRMGPWIKDRILLIDLGFYKHQLFARIKENGGHFVSRLKGNADPLITGVYNTCRGNSIDVVGKRLSEVLPKLKRQITDITQDVLGPEDVAKLYGARWEIELIFKELKSRYALDVVNTKNAQIVEAYIWIAILTLFISRRIYSLVRKYSPKEKIVRYTQLRWSRIFAENASDQLTLILRYCGIERTFETVMKVYESQAIDPHVNRYRFREEWWA